MKRFLICAGDPLGCGPYVTAACWRKIPLKLRKNLFILGDWGSLVNAFAAARSKIPKDNIIITGNEPRLSNKAAARVAAASLDAAASLVKSGDAEAVVTAPVNKKRMRLMWPKFTGQTEFFGERLKCDPVMMFCPPAWKRNAFPIVFLATTHHALSKVPSLMRRGKIKYVLDVAVAHLRKRGIARPSVAVLGLNPHAGEGGEFGSEDEAIIRRVVNSNAMHAKIEGPIPADTFFSGRHKNFDGVIAMYHDQGLIPAKMMWGMNAVNVTLGLPVVRTSPGHGTAEGVPHSELDSNGMLAAIKVAMEISKSKY